MKKYKTSAGYLEVYLPIDHPARDMARKNGLILEHRLIIAQELNRHLFQHEIVHHKDGNKTNNHPDNLELTTRGSHNTRRMYTEDYNTGFNDGFWDGVETAYFELGIHQEYLALRKSGNLDNIYGENLKGTPDE